MSRCWDGSAPAIRCGCVSWSTAVSGAANPTGALTRFSSSFFCSEQGLAPRRERRVLRGSWKPALSHRWDLRQRCDRGDQAVPDHLLRRVGGSCHPRWRRPPVACWTSGWAGPQADLHDRRPQRCVCRRIRQGKAPIDIERTRIPQRAVVRSVHVVTPAAHKESLISTLPRPFLHPAHPSSPSRGPRSRWSSFPPRFGPPSARRSTDPD